MSDKSGRLLNTLPAIYRAADTSGQLGRLLGVFEDVLFGSPAHGRDGIEQQIAAIPSVFAPLGVAGDEQQDGARAPSEFLPWLAGWVAFSPYAFFTAEQLRPIVAGITPLYGKRGTRDYVEQLLRLCFDEILDVEIDERPIFGLRVGHARIGEDTLLGSDRPFWFRVAIEARPSEEKSGERWESKFWFEQRLRAVIDFAKPAHTDYDLRLRFAETGEVGSSGAAIE